MTGSDVYPRINITNRRLLDSTLQDIPPTRLNKAILSVLDSVVGAIAEAWPESVRVRHA